MKKNKIALLLVMAALLGIFTAWFICEPTQTDSKEAITNEEAGTDNSPEESSDGTDAVQKIPQKGNSTNTEYVEKLLAEMSLDEKIYQMLFVTPESITGVGQVIQAGDGTKTALAKHPVGGIIYFAQNIQDRQQLKTMIENTQSYSKIPLFIGVDEEGGQVSRLKNAGIRVQPPMKQIGETGDSSEAYRVGCELGEDLSELGFNVDFAPVADVLTNPNNTVIDNRAFGSDPELVSDMVAQEVMGLQEKNVSAALKHFPGHGDTSTDSHTGYSQSNQTLDQLRECEFLPFRAGIEAGADFVMVAHITTVNATKENVPATLSKELITDCLINELNFEGIVITDSFQMGAITQNYSTADAVVKSIEAGVDMVLMPADVAAAHSALKTAVESGKLTEERINESVRKILAVKLKRNII